ncbi:MAG: hypothetical protein WKF66_21425 [Pedobacter sp.]
MNFKKKIKSVAFCKSRKVTELQQYVEKPMLPTGGLAIWRFFILIAFCWTSFAYGQDNIKKYVQENTIQIKAIEPDSTDYSDLEAFGNSIGNSKIVMLGEQDHGDAATFLAKTRLIKYLHV